MKGLKEAEEEGEKSPDNENSKENFTSSILFKD